MPAHGGGGGVFARGVTEDEGVVEGEFVGQGTGRGVVFLGFSGEADDDIGRDGDTRTIGA